MELSRMQSDQLKVQLSKELEDVFSILDCHEPRKEEEQKLEGMDGLTQTLSRSVKKKQINNYTVRADRNEMLQNDELYHYGTQKYSIYEQQKKEQREMIQKDRKNHYTYSEQYLTLSINPYDEYDEKKKEEARLKAMNVSSKEFKNVT